MPTGEHSFQARASDAAGNSDETEASRAFTVELAPPDTAPPALVEFDFTPKSVDVTTGSRTVSVTARVTDATGAEPPYFLFSSQSTSQTAGFGQMTLSSGTPQDGTYTRTVTIPQGAAPGDWDAVVYPLEDTAGNSGSFGPPAGFPKILQVIVDTTAPQTTVDSGPAGATSDATPTFGFSSSETGSSFECRVDDASFAACDSPTTTAALADGDHTFEARATDAAGNVDATPASRSFIVDTAPPQTTIESGPAGLTNDSTPTFGLLASEAGSSFECRVDSVSFAACDSPTTTAALSDGPHTFDVRATDAAGNADITPASRSFTVDATAPQTTIDSGPSGAINDATPTFAFSSSESGSSFECRADNASFAACASPQTTAALTDGSHTIEVRAIDGGGNPDATPATRTFTVDTAAPQTAIDSGPAGAVNDATPTFGFSSSEGGSSFECRVDSASFAACASPETTAALADGNHTFEVRATDGAGNPDGTAASRGFRVDSAPPQTTLDSGPAGTTNDSTPTFSFASSEVGSGFVCRLDSAGFTACGSPNTTAVLADGQHTFRVRAIDAAGNTDASEATRTFTVDTPAPVSGSGGATPAPGAGGGSGGAGDLGPAPQGPSVAEPMTLTVSSKKARLSLVLAKGLRVTGRCSAPCTLKARLSLDRRTAKRLKLKTLVATGSGPGTAGASSRVTLRFNAKAKKALRRLRKTTLTLTVFASGAQGTGAVRRILKVKLKR